ncbi:MAG TPA: two-component regulator propeller domain-containing protein [Pyrinomonadaceae bacterium]|nr:two-component regulator propeller domain-containing protein [Pyrinomonadaceae bacterium]
MRRRKAKSDVRRASGRSREAKGGGSLRALRRAHAFMLAVGLVAGFACGFVSLAQNESDTSRAVETLNEDSSVRVKNLHQWGAVSSFHGLPSDRVRAIAQDRAGVMWFGTDQGLARYDGRRVQAVVSEGLPAGRVLALKVDADGILWVGTETGAAQFLDNDFRSITEIAGKAVAAIHAPETGRVILSTAQGLIFECRRNTDAALSVKQIPDEPLASADVDQPGALAITSLAMHDGKLLAGTQSRGLLSIEGDEAKEFLHRPFFINALATAAGGRLWIGARAKRDESGLYMANDPAHPSKIDVSTGTVTALELDERGDLWVGTAGRGAFRYRGTQQLDHFTFEGTAGGLRSDDIYVIFIDREGVVWFGTDRGVCRYDPRSPRIENVSEDKQSNFVRTLYQTRDGQLLCGTNRGLFIYDAEAARWLPVQGLANRTIHTVAEDSAGKLLVGSSSGLYVNVNLKGSEGADYQHAITAVETDSEAEQQQQPTESVRAIRIFQGKTHIASYGRGVERVEGERRLLVWPVASPDARLKNVTSLHTDGNDRLWIGTAENGVFIFDGREAKQDGALETLRGSPVWAIDGTRDGGLWFATARGLYSYRAGELRLVTPDTDVRSVVAGNPGGTSVLKGVWCATAGGGLLHIVADAEFGTLVSRLDVEQGLPSQKAFAILPLRDGGSGAESLLIGTNRGVVRYSPGNTLPLLLPTRILSRRLHQPEEMRAGINLDYPQNSLALEVAALSSRTFPEQFQYAFLLRDAAGSIIKKKLSPDSQFLIENLRPGQYQVEVRAFSKDLLASTPLNFNFNVAKAPFPWTTVALSVLLVLVLVALVWAIVEHRRIARASTALSRANRELASARLDLANEAERERRRIARDLHDQTLADLRHLLMLIDQLPTAANAPQANGHGATLEAATFRSEIEGVSNEIRRICEDLSPSVLENVGLTAAIEWALTNAASSHVAPNCKFEYEFVCDEELEAQLDLAPAVQMQVYRIAQEVLNNICRHASATRVRLSVTNSDEASFVMIIEDDGRGFDAQTRRGRKGRGLANIRARASLIEADASWEKSPSGGTIFTLRKPRATQAADQSS